MELWNGAYRVDDLVLILFRSIQRNLNKSKVKTKNNQKGKESNKETQSSRNKPFKKYHKNANLIVKSDVLFAFSVIPGYVEDPRLFLDSSF